VSPAEAGNLRVLNETRGTELGSRIEVADSSATRRSGLLKRSGLAAGEGLWIVPCEAIHTFFMQFSIDVVFLTRDRKVAKIVKHLRKWRVAACLSAHSVLELPAGSVQQTRTEPGDQLTFER
jgi:uncharacterized membrane protein (UPF0127 family)